MPEKSKQTASVSYALIALATGSEAQHAWCLLTYLNHEPPYHKAVAQVTLEHTNQIIELCFGAGMIPT